MENEQTTALPTEADHQDDPAAIYARLEHLAARKGYTLTRTAIVGYALRRGSVSKHFKQLETGFQLLG